MKFIDAVHPGGPEVLRLADHSVPRPGPEHVLIRVMAAGVNRPDLAQREGRYPPPPGASPILGLEVAGVVAAVGTPSRWKVGDAVCALTPGGGYAEYCVAPDVQCLPIPQGLSFEKAAGIPETFFTVWANVFQLGGLKAGERFLVHGGTSGIGTTAIQLAHAFGATVYATAGTAAKCEACRRLGAREAFNYHSEDFLAGVQRDTENGGVHVILDIVGAPYTAKNLEALAPRGRLVQVAVQQGAEATVNLARIMQKRLTITGSTMRPRPIAEKGIIARELQEQVWPLLEAQQVKVLVDRVFPFEQAADAHRYLESGQHIGKIILKLG
jgi:NADPH:quinone reductase